MYEIRDCGGITVIDLPDPLVFGESTKKFQENIASLSQNGHRKIAINMARIHSIDSSGIGELLKGFICLKKLGIQFKLFSLTRHTAEILHRTKLESVFEIYETEKAALHSF